VGPASQDNFLNKVIVYNGLLTLKSGSEAPAIMLLLFSKFRFTRCQNWPNYWN